MRISISIFNPQADDQDSLISLEIFPEMTLGTLRESIHAEASIPPSSQHIYHNGRLVSDDSRTIEQLQMADGDLLALHVRQAGSLARRPQDSAPTTTSGSASTFAQPQRPQIDTERLRLQILGDPTLRQQIQQQHPELASAVDDASRFARVFSEAQNHERRERRERQREIERLNEDPFNVENQKKIEDMIRQERVMENLQNAVEYTPEVFGRVHMLYIDVEVNGHKVKAFVDSGAQATIISPSCAEACGIMRLLDTRYTGIAQGVGTAVLAGRIHSAQIKIGSLHLPCSFTVIDGKTTDLLLGLDMLKRFQAVIDLSRDRLVIHGEEIPFLAEADIPREKFEEPAVPGPGGTAIRPQSGVILSPQEAQKLQTTGAPSGAANLRQGSTAAPTNPPVTPPAAAETDVTPAHVDSLVAMGATRMQAVQALRAADDNVEVAASLIFL